MSCRSYTFWWGVGIYLVFTFAIGHEVLATGNGPMVVGALLMVWPLLGLLALLAGAWWLGRRLLRATVRVVRAEWHS